MFCFEFLLLLRSSAGKSVLFITTFYLSVMYFLFVIWWRRWVVRY